MKWQFYVPLALFAVLTGFLARGLVLDPSEIPSPLIDKPAPEFTTNQLLDDRVMFNSADMAGQVWLLNIWASWCTSCIQEHPLFVELGQQNLLPIVGLNYKDKAHEAKAWLQQHGNPYTIVAADLPGKIGIDWGVYGVPETFLIDSKGIIRYKHIGPVDEQALRDTLMPLIKELLDERSGAVS